MDSRHAGHRITLAHPGQCTHRHNNFSKYTHTYKTCRVHSQGGCPTMASISTPCSLWISYTNLSLVCGRHVLHIFFGFFMCKGMTQFRLSTRGKYTLSDSELMPPIC